MTRAEFVLFGVLAPSVVALEQVVAALGARVILKALAHPFNLVGVLQRRGAVSSLGEQTE